MRENYLPLTIGYFSPDTYRGMCCNLRNIKLHLVPMYRSPLSISTKKKKKKKKHRKLLCEVTMT